MKLQTQIQDCKVRQDLVDKTEQMIYNLEDKQTRIISGKLWFKEIENDHEKNKIVEIILQLPGVKVFSLSQEMSFENAITEAIDNAKNQLQKYKNKYQSDKINTI